MECWSFAFFCLFVRTFSFSFCCHHHNSRHSTHTFTTIPTHAHTNEFHLLFHLFRRIYFTLLFIPLKCYCNWQCVPRLLFVLVFCALRSFDGITMYTVNCEKYLLNATINNCCNELKTICFCFGFCFFFSYRRKRDAFNIVNNAKLQWKCEKGGTECLSICQQCHNRRRNKKLQEEYSKQWRHHNNESNDVRHIEYFTRSFILHLVFSPFPPFPSLSNWFQSKFKSTAVFAISPKYLKQQYNRKREIHLVAKITFICHSVFSHFRQTKGTMEHQQKPNESAPMPMRKTQKKAQDCCSLVWVKQSSSTRTANSWHSKIDSDSYTQALGIYSAFVTFSPPPKKAK